MPCPDLSLYVRDLPAATLDSYRLLPPLLRDLVKPPAVTVKRGLLTGQLLPALQRTVEIEAEAVAYIVTMRAGLAGSSAAYVSRYMSEGKIPPAVSLDLIAKVAARLEEMAHRKLEARRPREKRARVDR